MRKIFIFLFSVLAICFDAKGSDACECDSPPPPKKALKESDCVFVGKVVRHEFENPLFNDPSNKVKSSGQKVRYYFEVEEIWKGTKSKEIVVVSSPSDADCGYRFSDGERYIIYALISRWGLTNSDSARLVTGICSRTNTLVAAAEDLKELGEGEKIK